MPDDDVTIALEGRKIVCTVPFHELSQENDEKIDLAFRQPHRDFGQAVSQDGCDVFFLQCLSIATRIIEIAAGVMPGILAAWPTFSGCTFLSFSMTSRESPGIDE